MLALGQERTTVPTARQYSALVSAVLPLTSSAPPVTYAPADVKILGALDYGETSDSIEWSASPHFRAVVFSGYGGEKIEATVTGTDRKAFVAITDSTLVQIASGATHLSVRLPDRGPDIEVFYILFRTIDNTPARFTVHVMKTENGPYKIPTQASTDSTH
jgi:hypothetical protein